MTDYTDPSTIDVDEVIANITHDYSMRGDSWTDRLSWPNVTVKALADEVQRLRRALGTGRFVLHLVPHEGDEPLVVGPFADGEVVHAWIDDHDEGEWDSGTVYVLESPGDESGESDDGE